MLQFKHAVMNQCIFYCIQSNITFFFFQSKNKMQTNVSHQFTIYKIIKKTMGFPSRWCLIVKLYMITDY